MKYDITDIKKFIDSARTIVYHNYIQNDPNDTKLVFDYEKLTKKQKEEINLCLSHTECLTIFNEISEGKKSFTDKKFQKFLDALSYRMTSNLINSMVNRGLLETAFDESKNDFIFWAKEDNT